MNYKERINALNNFKSQVSAGETTDSLANESSDVDDWTGGAKSRFDIYISNCKNTTSKLSGYKASFLTDIDNLINHIQACYDSEYNANVGIVTAQYSNDASKNRTERMSRLNGLNIDTSVKTALMSLI